MRRTSFLANDTKRGGSSNLFDSVVVTLGDIVKRFGVRVRNALKYSGIVGVYYEAYGSSFYDIVF